jgi:hypothetical protein
MSTEHLTESAETKQKTHSPINNEKLYCIICYTPINYNILDHKCGLRTEITNIIISNN